MSVEQIYKCVCGTQKQATNHWFLLFYLPSGVVRLEKWNPAKINFAGAVHLCGQACLSKAVSQWTTEPIAITPGTETEEDAALSTNMDNRNSERS